MESKNNNPIILPPTSAVYKAFSDATNKRMVFFTGLSGVGKSLYIQQFSKMAELAGRKVHLLQWDVTREAFQNEQSLAAYPEIAGVTHSMIRKAVGVWTRKGIEQWHQKYPESEHILIGELPLVGNRLIEIVQRQEDSAELLLSSEQTHFFLPVPSESVREHIVGCRSQSIDNPTHQREAADAPPSVVNANWLDIRNLAIQLELAKDDNNSDYSAATYAGAYEHLLQHRNYTTLHINEILETKGSVYEVGEIHSELAANEEDAEAIFDQLKAKYSLAEIEAMTEHWYQL